VLTLFLHTISKGLGPGSVVVDLGSGDGILLVAAAQKGAHAIGYELSRWVALYIQAYIIYMNIIESYTHIHTHTHVYMYERVCAWVCVCVRV